VAFIIAALFTGTAITSGSGRDGFTLRVPEDTASIVHLLKRATFGPRPDDIERVRSLGIERWVDWQLHPDRIGDAGLEARLAPLETLRLSTRELAERHYVPAMRERRERLRRLPPPMTDSPDASQSQADTSLRSASRSALSDAGRMQRDASTQVIEQKLLRAASSERQLQEVLVDFWFNHFNVSANKGPTRLYILEYERDVIRPHVLGRFRDLLGATARSPAMLFYLDNWMSSDPDAALQSGTLSRGRGSARVGRGRRLGQPSDRTMRERPNPQNRRPRGINENYARELLELHTLGVDGGYSQRDVSEVARAFTGWTIEDPRGGGSFVFRSALHDNREKVVLGTRIAGGGGERDGERVLDLLSRHPSTARFIATKLAARFVSDSPPATLVDRLSATFQATDGDLRAIMRTLLVSPEFFAKESRGAKVKTPLEFVVSAVRALDTTVVRAQALGRSLRELGMPLYMAQAPTGYSDASEAWVTAGALVARMNFAVALTSRRLPGLDVPSNGGPAASPDTSPRPDDGVSGRRNRTSSSPVDRIVAELLHGEVSLATRATIAKAESANQMTALALGSPEFQRQ
jgi:uncharacterized protein (DUF1800 family)